MPKGTCRENRPGVPGAVRTSDSPRCSLGKVEEVGAAADEDVRGRVPDRCLLLRDERFPPGACDANRSRTARSAPQGSGAKGREANVRPKEHRWAVRQDVRGECANNHEARESLRA